MTVPRDRQGEFEPKAVKKYEHDISGTEDKVLGMYAKGMTTRDISAHLEEIYGIDASHTLISKITDKILPIAQEWQHRPLESIYPIIFLDDIHYKVRSDGKVVNKAAIKANYPNTQIQRCIIHQIRNSTKYIPWKHRKAFCSDLKLVYSAPTEEMALMELDKLKANWNDLYSIAINSRYNQEVDSKCTKLGISASAAINTL